MPLNITVALLCCLKVHTKRYSTQNTKSAWKLHISSSNLSPAGVECKANDHNNFIWNAFVVRRRWSSLVTLCPRRVFPWILQRYRLWPAGLLQLIRNKFRNFISLCNYYCCYNLDFATMAKPLHWLTEKTCEFQWSDQCAEAFWKLNQRLSQVPILAFPDFTKTLVLGIMTEYGWSSRRRMMTERQLLRMPVKCSARPKGDTASQRESCWLLWHSFSTSTRIS